MPLLKGLTAAFALMLLLAALLTVACGSQNEPVDPTLAPTTATAQAEATQQATAQPVASTMTGGISPTPATSESQDPTPQGATTTTQAPTTTTEPPPPHPRQPHRLRIETR